MNSNDFFQSMNMDSTISGDNNYINNDIDIYKVEVIDENDAVKIKMDINSIDYNSDYNDK